ncbi:hypothetical protein M501DRAFT_944449 [Patellaria atrata CBS 101060]|uniref:AB hydrolase-1 domain-containing protein n=1 Tax=Patellaria atrata CBS 101060 TaxID=1346257 RepID=A0A9P4VIQ9_9PEZI|nr:hypothetical protein M501DRAFT_944449 [Patellaria atrata CBS 101060]
MKPNYTFVIPSLLDDTPLDCRIYLPKITRRTSTAGILGDISLADQISSKHGAIIAHPYAPLGGSYDDPVVGLTAKELLSLGFIVGLFNFRGAGNSKGRTSWSGRPELEDYITFINFFVHFLDNFQPSSVSPSTSPHPLPPHSSAQKINVILGGYSYGSLVLSHLPPTNDILQRLRSHEEGTTASEVLLRAKSLASQATQESKANVTAGSHSRKERRNDKGHAHSHSVTIGGEETSVDVRRRSHDGLRRSLDISRRFKSARRKSEEHTTLSLDSSYSSSIPVASTAYLIIAPLQPPVSVIIHFSFPTAFLRKTPHDSYESSNFHRTLAVFGDQDIFSSVKKQRAWAEKMRSESGSLFEYQEVPGAGHFWHEEGVSQSLRDAVHRWALDLISCEQS